MPTHEMNESNIRSLDCLLQRNYVKVRYVDDEYQMSIDDRWRYKFLKLNPSLNVKADTVNFKFLGWISV